MTESKIHAMRTDRRRIDSCGGGLGLVEKGARCEEKRSAERRRSHQNPGAFKERHNRREGDLGKKRGEEKIPGQAWS